MKKYQTDRAIAQNIIREDKHSLDITRTHAINWGVGVAILFFCGYALTWTVLKMFITKIPVWTLALVFLAPLIGFAWGAYKLINYTEEYRDWLYETEDYTQTDINGDGLIGEPDPDNIAIPLNGTLIRGIDGQMKRIDTGLSLTEIQEIKRLLLLDKKATVRTLTNVIGERASRFRLELIKLGICEKPAYDKAPAVLSGEGARAVMRW